MCRPQMTQSPTQVPRLRRHGRTEQRHPARASDGLNATRPSLTPATLPNSMSGRREDRPITGRGSSSRSVECTTSSHRRRLQPFRESDWRATSSADSSVTSATARTISSRMWDRRVSFLPTHIKRDGGFFGARRPLSWGQVLGTGSRFLGEAQGSSGRGCGGEKN